MKINMSWMDFEGDPKGGGQLRSGYIPSENMSTFIARYYRELPKNITIERMHYTINNAGISACVCLGVKHSKALEDHWILESAPPL